MHYVILGAVALAVLIGLGQLFVRTDVRLLVQVLRYVVGGVLIIFGAVFAVAGRPVLGLPMVFFGVSALFTGRLFGIDFGGHDRPSRGGGSTVRSNFLEMRLDHETGDLGGTIVAGQFSGRELNDLGDGELLELYRELAGDGDSLALLEAYLDRRIPAWREHFQDDAAAGTASASYAGPMTEKQAYEILGLLPGASNAEIRAAHRRLMKRVHPDQGGSTFLASRINEAKDFLLGRHR